MGTVNPTGGKKKREKTVISDIKDGGVLKQGSQRRVRRRKLEGFDQEKTRRGRMLTWDYEAKEKKGKLVGLKSLY